MNIHKITLHLTGMIPMEKSTDAVPVTLTSNTTPEQLNSHPFVPKAVNLIH